MRRQRIARIASMSSALRKRDTTVHRTLTVPAVRSMAGRLVLWQSAINGRKTRHVFPCLTRRGATAYDDRTPYVLEKTGVRIATPKEWERLFGFPDDYTLVPYKGKPAADSPRYKALGNSMAVPVMWWIGERIQKWENMLYADG